MNLEVFFWRFASERRKDFLIQRHNASASTRQGGKLTRAVKQQSSKLKDALKLLNAQEAEQEIFAESAA